MELNYQLICLAQFVQHNGTECSSVALHTP